VFEEFIREIRRLERPVTVRIDLPLDEKGYLDRSCSHRECRCDFKVLYEDWRDKVPDKEAWCPKCGNRAEPTEYNTAWQKKHIAEFGRAYMAKRLNQTLSRAAQRTRPKTISAGLFGITMSVKHKAGTEANYSALGGCHRRRERRTNPLLTIARSMRCVLSFTACSGNPPSTVPRRWTDFSPSFHKKLAEAHATAP
jgi:hypothetical protein